MPPSADEQPHCPKACTSAPLAGTFLQPLVDLRGLTVDDWCSRLAYIPAFGARELFLQWLVFDKVSFVGTLAQEDGPASNTFLVPLLEAAARLGVRVHLGLVADSQFGPTLQGDAGTVADYLATLREASLDVARAAFAVAKGSPAFAGWYLPEEIDDVNWRGAGRSELLALHLKALCRGLYEIGSAREVSISTYVTGAADPDQFGLFWLRILLEAPLTVLLQDGAGVDAQRWRGIGPYAEALRGAANSLGHHWTMVIELFAQQSGPPLDNKPFSARPATMPRVAAQIELAHQLGAARLIGFTLGDYMLSEQTAAPNALGAAYLADHCGSRDGT